MSNREARSVAEVLHPEQEHLRSKQAFEAAVADFDKITDIEDAWQHLDNWQFDSGGRNYQSYVYDKEAKIRAITKLAAGHQALTIVFAGLPEASQRNLVERPVITFECRGNESNGRTPASFEFNLPEIVAGFEAWQRLSKHHNRQWRQAVKAGQIEMEASAYGHTYWQSQALFHDSIGQASSFLIAGKKRFYESELNTPETQLALTRITQMEKLSEIYLGTLSNGDEATRLALHAWMRRVNGSILRVCENTEVATRMFQKRIDLWIQNVYPHEGALVPIGRTMVDKKNVKHIEHNEYIANY